MVVGKTVKARRNSAQASKSVLPDSISRLSDMTAEHQRPATAPDFCSRVPIAASGRRVGRRRTRIHSKLLRRCTTGRWACLSALFRSRPVSVQPYRNPIRSLSAKAARASRVLPWPKCCRQAARGIHLPVTSLEEHKAAVAAAIATIRQTRLEKVVLARAVDVTFEDEPDPLLIAARLIDLSANRDGFAVDLSATGRDETRAPRSWVLP